MAREIRFRAWDVNKKKMLNVELWDFKNGGWDLRDPNGGKGHYTEDEENIIMQYTGLKDKKGTTIYEGDLIEFRAKDEDGIMIKDRRVVEWDEKTSCWTIRGKTGDGRWILEGLGEWQEEITHDGKMKHETVIGNIYENPELLK